MIIYSFIIQGTIGTIVRMHFAAIETEQPHKLTLRKAVDSGDWAEM